MKKLNLVIALMVSNYVGFTQTLQSVTEVGNTTNQSIQIGGGYVNSNSTKLFINNSYGKKFAISSGANMVSESGLNIYNWTDNPNTPLFTLSNEGNVGIGSIMPENVEGWDKVLEVRGGRHAKSLVSSSNVISGLWSHNLGHYGAPAGGITGTFSNHPFSIITDQSVKLTVATNGNVGIGTTTPEQKLSVMGSVLTSVNSDEGASLVLENPKKISNNAYRWALYNMTGGYGNSLQFWNYSQDGSYGSRFTLADDGNVGIGTISPKEKLSVNGKIRAHEVKVETANWPDYVFEADYRKMSLAALENYIKINKHLPEMPKAKDIESNGLDLGGLVKLQQKKIEELTLHLIEQDKRMNRMSEELKKLKRKK